MFSALRKPCCSPECVCMCVRVCVCVYITHNLQIDLHMHMLTWIHFEGGGDAFCKQGLVHELRLVGRHYLVIGTLKKQDGARQGVCRVYRRPFLVDLRLYISSSSSIHGPVYTFPPFSFRSQKIRNQKNIYGALPFFIYFRCKILYMGNICIEGGNSPALAQPSPSPRPAKASAIESFLFQLKC